MAFSRFFARQFAQPKGWIGRWWIGPWLDRISDRMNQLALAEMRLAPTDHVLEVGFGGGGLLAMILDSTSGRVIGADISGAMVERAGARFQGQPRLRLVEASVQALPIERQSIDKAVSVNNIYFWPDERAALAELARVIRPGGTLSICFEPPIELRKWPGHRHGFRLLEESEVVQLLEGAGFRSIRRSEGRGRRPDHFLCLTGVRRAVDAAS